jgi:hypothetical protein
MSRLFLFVVFMVAAMLGAFASQASASITLTIGDQYYVGYFSPGQPASLAEEMTHINHLITLSAGAGPVAGVGGQTYARSSNTGPFVQADSTGAVKDESAPLSQMTLTGTFEYFIGKYNAGNAGTAVWYVPEGATGTITLPGDFLGHDISHASAFHHFGPNFSHEAPEPMSLVVWSVLGAVALCGVKKRRAK